LFELLPFFTFNTSKQIAPQPSISQKSMNSKPTILPKPKSRKIGVKIDMLRSAKVLGQVKDDQDKENHKNIRLVNEEEHQPLHNNVVQVNMPSPEIQSSDER
jgi:hypothetical protein